MRIRWRHAQLAVPLVLVNLVPVAGVVFLGWKVLALCLLFWFETQATILLGILHLLVSPSQRGERWRDRTDMAAPMLLAMAFFGGGALWIIMGTVGLHEMRRMPLTGDIFRDFAMLVDNLQLLVPLAIVVAFHSVQEIREWRSTRRPLRMFVLGIVRFFVLMLMLIPVAGVLVMTDAQEWALVALVLAKLVIDIGSAVVTERFGSRSTAS